MENIDYGITEELLEQRANTEQKHVDAITTALNILVEDAKEYGDWTTLISTTLKERFNLKMGIDAFSLIYSLADHPNIITSTSCVKGKGLRRPLMYKYVDESEKIRLRFKGVFYKKITPDFLAYIEQCFVNEEKPPVNGILCVLDHLISCKADMGWVKLTPISLSAKTGMRLNDVLNIFSLLGQKHLVCYHTGIRQLSRSRQNIAVRIVNNEDEYDMILKESQDSNTKLYNGFVPSENAVNNLIQGTREAVYCDINHRENILKEKSQEELDKKEIHSIIENIDGENILLTYKNIINELIDEIAELKKENVKLRMQNKVLSMTRKISAQERMSSHE